MITYLSSPYSHDDPTIVEKRVDLTIKACAYLLTKGYNTFSPIIQGHYILKVCPEVAGDWGFWQNFCRSYIDKSETMVVLKIDGWDKSIGVSQEMLYARLNNITIIYLMYENGNFILE